VSHELVVCVVYYYRHKTRDNKNVRTELQKQTNKQTNTRYSYRTESTRFKTTKQSRHMTTEVTDTLADEDERVCLYSSYESLS